MAVLRDLVFSEPLGFRPISLDLHLPAASGSPLVLFVHGGGWRVGSRRVFGPEFPGEEAFEAIVAAGFAVASVDYRLSGEVHFPAPRDDVAAALDWLAAHGSEYGYDAQRIVIWGESAGATLGALVALRKGSPVRGMIAWYPPTNLVELGAPEGSREGELLGGTADELPELAREASPVFQVHADAPPFYIAHGTADRFVAFTQGEQLAKALTDVGASVEFEAVAGGDHMWRGDVDRQGLLERAIGFAEKVTA